MIAYLMNRYGLDRHGAIGLLKGIVWTVCINLTLLVPVGYLAYIVEMVVEKNVSHILVHVCLCIVLFVCMFLVHWKQYGAVYTATYDQSEVRRVRLAEKLRRVPLSYLNGKDVADVANTLMGDCDDLEFAFSHAIPQMVGGLVSALIVGFCLFIVDVRLACILLVPIVPGWGLMVLGRKMVKSRDEASYVANRSVIEGMQECIESIEALRAYNYTSGYLDRLNERLDVAEGAGISGEVIRGFLATASQSVLKLGLAFVILFGGLYYVDGSLSLFKYLFFLLMSARFYEPICGALIFFSALLFTDVRIERLKGIMGVREHDGVKEWHANRYDIRFENVGFSYNGQDRVLNGVSFVAKQGEVTALVGPSGSGKSTVARLAARFWDLDTGCICVGDVDISSVEEEALLEAYSFVFQDVVLFNGSVLENIRIGKKGASDQEVYEAARLAQCDDFVQRLERGYDTNIGENGARLSGGERQRISVARALLKGAPILILDEATASMDVENETRLQQALSTLIQDKTVLVIAHRMRTVLGADRVVVLDKGRVVEEGSPEQLLKKNGLFKRMNELQSMGKDWSV